MDGWSGIENIKKQISDQPIIINMMDLIVMCPWVPWVSKFFFFKMKMAFFMVLIEKSFKG